MLQTNFNSINYILFALCRRSIINKRMLVPKYTKYDIKTDLFVVKKLLPRY